MASQYAQVPSVGVHSHQEITPQASVSTKVNMSPNIIAERTRSIYGLSADQYVPGDLNPTTLCVRNQELIFIQKERQRAGMSNVSSRVEGFSAFNGLTFPAGIRTARQFSRLFKFVGVATGTLDFTKDIPNRNGVAVQIAGSKTINNSSNTTFSPGDVVGFVPPYLNESDRARQYRSVLSRKRADHGVRGKLTATLEKITYENISEVMNAISTNVINSNNQYNIPLYRLEVVRGGSPPVDPDVDRAIWLKQLLLLNAYETLITAYDQGIINWNGNFGTYNNISDPNLINSEISRQNPAGGKRPSLIQAAKANGTTAAVVDATAQHLACVLGLARHPNDAVKEDHILTSQIMARTLMGSVDPSVFENYSTGREPFVSEFTTLATQLKNSLGQPTIYPTVPKQIVQAQNSAADMFGKVFAESISEVYDRAIGHCSNVSVPNGPLHLCM
jgi:hypothetical protein